MARTQTNKQTDIKRGGSFTIGVHEDPTVALAAAAAAVADVQCKRLCLQWQLLLRQTAAAA